MKYLVSGAGGLLYFHLVQFVRRAEVVVADVKPLEYWFQLFEKSKNFSLDLKDYSNCLK